jgi:hypothetical protein
MKNIPNEAEQVATRKGEILLLDLTWVRTASFEDKWCFWLLIVDEYTHFLWSYFMKKIEVIKKTTSLLNQIQKDKGVKVKVIRCDNAGENMALAAT